MGGARHAGHPADVWSSWTASVRQEGRGSPDHWTLRAPVLPLSNEPTGELGIRYEHGCYGALSIVRL